MQEPEAACKLRVRAVLLLGVRPNATVSVAAENCFMPFVMPLNLADVAYSGCKDIIICFRSFNPSPSAVEDGRDQFS